MAATRIPGPHLSNGSAQAQQPKVQQNELEVLNPEREITLGGKTYTVREYGHVEWLKLLYKVEPLVALITKCIDTRCVERLSAEDVLLLVSEHFDVMMPIITQATDMSLQELDTLEFKEIQALITTWWNVNGLFLSTARWRGGSSRCRRCKTWQPHNRLWRNLRHTHLKRAPARRRQALYLETADAVLP